VTHHWVFLHPQIPTNPQVSMMASGKEEEFGLLKLEQVYQWIKISLVAPRRSRK
jgi:hypothetical protein